MWHNADAATALFFNKLTDDSPSPYKKLALKFHLGQYLKISHYFSWYGTTQMQPQPYLKIQVQIMLFAIIFKAAFLKTVKSVSE